MAKSPLEIAQISESKKSDKQCRCLTHDFTDEYIDLRSFINLPSTPYFISLYHKPYLYTMSKARFKSIKAQYNCCFFLRYLLIKFWRTNVMSTVLFSSCFETKLRTCAYFILCGPINKTLINYRGKQLSETTNFMWCLCNYSCLL